MTPKKCNSNGLMLLPVMRDHGPEALLHVNVPYHTPAACRQKN